MRGHKGKTSVNVGDRFGRLVVLGFTRRFKASYSRVGVYCQCDCGNLVCTLAQSLKRGATKSCGCYRAFMRRQGKRYLDCDSSMKCRSKVYVRWYNMRHSEQGVVPEWDDYSVFKAWWFDNGFTDGPRMQMRLLDRSKPYGPGNVRVRPFDEARLLARKETKSQRKSPEVLENAVYNAYKNTDELVREIAERFCISQNTVTNIAARMERQGK